MEEPEPLHVENSFNEFIKEFGGELVSELLPANPPFDNADYLFRNEQVVMELKCLEQEVLELKEYKSRLNTLFESWIQNGLLPDVGYGTFELDTGNLPPKCKADVDKLVIKPVQRVIE